MNTTYESKIDHPIEILDEYYPLWYEKINLLTFDMFSSTYCILAQLFPDMTYEGAYNNLVRLGYKQNGSFGEHQDSWVQAIEKRLKEKGNTNA